MSKMFPKLVILAAVIPIAISSTTIETLSGPLEYDEEWNYTQVRPDAFTFWWYYYKINDINATNNRPIYMWLQLQQADLLFVDNPVGTGFSYVTNESAYTKTTAEISQDLLTFLTAWFNDHPEYQKRPFYILSESYGGKMTAHFATVLYQAIQDCKIACNLKGVGLGDSWISPIDFVGTWGDYLYYMSYLSDTGRETYNLIVEHCSELVVQEDWVNATHCFDSAQYLIRNLTSGISWYNVIKGDLINYDLPLLMNGLVREKLGIIPPDVTWKDGANRVFNAQAGDFMKPVIDSVDKLLDTPVKVVVYNGQLDLIVDTPGLKFQFIG